MQFPNDKNVQIVVVIIILQLIIFLLFTENWVFKLLNYVYCSLDLTSDLFLTENNSF